jgi:hypothetical protein
MFSMLLHYLNSVRKERQKKSMKEEPIYFILFFKKRLMLATVKRVAMFNALFSHGYNSSQINSLNSPANYFATV